MEVIVMIHQHKVTIFSPAEESSTMVERLVEGILKRPPVQQWLYTDKQLLGDSMTLAECRYSCQMAPLKAPLNSGPGSSSRGGPPGFRGPQHGALLPTEVEDEDGLLGEQDWKASGRAVKPWNSGPPPQIRHQ